MFLVPAVMKLLGDECWWAPTWLKRLQARIGLGEIGLPDERKPRAEPEPEAESEDSLVGAGAPVTQWLPHDPTRPARPARKPALETTAPMPNTRSAFADEPTVAHNSSAGDPETNGDDPAASRPIPTPLQQDPDAAI
jgi:RND superfamily putative drug exporter